MTYSGYVKLLPTYEFYGLTEAQFKRLKAGMTDYECKKDFFKGGVENHLTSYGGYMASKGWWYFCIELSGSDGYDAFFPTSRDLTNPEYEKLIAEMDKIVNKFVALIEQEEP